MRRVEKRGGRRSTNAVSVGDPLLSQLIALNYLFHCGFSNCELDKRLNVVPLFGILEVSIWDSYLCLFIFVWFLKNTSYLYIFRIK